MEVGTWSLAVALALSFWGVVSGLIGVRTKKPTFLASARGAAFGASLGVGVAALSLWSALLGSDFRILYVAQETSVTLPLLYKFAALWSGFSGSLLLWTLILSVYVAYTVLRPNPISRPFMPVVTTVFLVVQFFFLLVLNVYASPFTPIAQPVLDGSGLNPLLQYTEMAIHPVLLYSGFVGMTVPYAFGMAGLWLGREGRDWLALTRRTTLVAWLFLTAGIVLGAHWSYRVLGWGGYWAWDPVENASFLPWLTATAFLHSAVMQDRRGMMRGWNVVLVLATFLLTLFGTFLTRSGIVSSIHAFTGTTVWPVFLGFLVLATGVSVTLIVRGWKGVQETSVGTDLVSKESSFLFNNLLLIGAAVAILWGTIFPLVTQGVLGQPLTAGPPFYNAVFAPIALALIVLMGVCPLIPWRRAKASTIIKNSLPSVGFGLVVFGTLFLTTHQGVVSASLGSVGMAIFTMVFEFVRGMRMRIKHLKESAGKAIYRLFVENRRRYGGYIVHIGILVMAIGIIGTQALAQKTTVTLVPGRPLTFGAYTFQLEGLHRGFSGPYPALWADLRVSAKGGGPLAVLTPSQVTYPFQTLPMGHPDIYSTSLTDIYTVLSGTEGSNATFLLLLNPLISWIWLGAMIAVLGIVIALGFTPPRGEPMKSLKEAAASWPL